MCLHLIKTKWDNCRGEHLRLHYHRYYVNFFYQPEHTHFYGVLRDSVPSVSFLSRLFFLSLNTQFIIHISMNFSVQQSTRNNKSITYSHSALDKSRRIHNFFLLQATSNRLQQCLQSFREFVRIFKSIIPNVGRDSSVGIATHHGLEGPGIESQWGGKIFRILPDLGQPSLLYNGYRVFPRGKTAGAWH
jgi:hypothetical protein